MEPCSVVPFTIARNRTARKEASQVRTSFLPPTTHTYAFLFQVRGFWGQEFEHDKEIRTGVVLVLFFVFFL